MLCSQCRKTRHTLELESGVYCDLTVMIMSVCDELAIGCWLEIVSLPSSSVAFCQFSLNQLLLESLQASASFKTFCAALVIFEAFSSSFLLVICQQSHTPEVPEKHIAYKNMGLQQLAIAFGWDALFLKWYGRQVNRKQGQVHDSSPGMQEK